MSDAKRAMALAATAPVRAETAGNSRFSGRLILFLKEIMRGALSQWLRPLAPIRLSAHQLQTHEHAEGLLS